MADEERSRERYGDVFWRAHHSPGELPPREPQLRIGSPHARFRQAELPADYIGALHERHALVKRAPPREAFAAEAAIGADNELFGCIPAPSESRPQHAPPVQRPCRNG